MCRDAEHHAIPQNCATSSALLAQCEVLSYLSCAWRLGNRSLVAAYRFRIRSQNWILGLDTNQVAVVQARPGALASVLLALAALAALGGGGLTCAALLLLLVFLLRHANADSDGVPGAGAARGRPGAASVPEDVSSEAGCSDASSGMLHCPAPLAPGVMACIAGGNL